MPSFRYKHGDRPLDGYVIQRGVGRGGFGEVYYAISDSGREVALKVIQGYEQIELRGVSQCMNLKSPHLVTIFDVRHNAEGIPFVIMEYVGGPSLRELCDQQPAGLGVQKAAFFLREIGKGLTYLHDCGIVHRDLKPGNIFYENGYVKIGDYGLSKAMSASQHSGQTVTVGTVHYMAPEIGLGRYDRSIDIYAMGAVLFEMITGQVPYLGASAGEILMKHMSSEPNVQGIEEPFATVIKKAMARDPAQRYQTVQEMVEGVFGAAHVRDSVSVFSPGDLTMVAGRVAGRVAVGVGGSSGPPMPPAPSPAPDSWQNVAFADRPNRVAGLATPPPLPMPQLPPPAPVAIPAQAPAPLIQADPLPQVQRNILAGVTVLIIALAAGAVAPVVDGVQFFPWMIFALFSMVGALGGIVLGRKYVLPKVPPDAGFVARLAVSGPAALVGLILSVPAIAIVGPRSSELLGRTWLGIILPLAILNWVKWTSPQRITRVSLFNALIAAGFGLLMVKINGGSTELGVAILSGVTLASAVLFPWTPRMYSPATAEPAAPAANAPVPAGLLNELRTAQQQPAPVLPRVHQGPLTSTAIYSRNIPDFVPWIWRGGMAMFIALGPVLIAAAESPSIHWNPQEDALGRGFGVGMIIFGVLCFFQSMRRRISGWWSYLIKPLVLFACLQIILICAFQLAGVNLHDEEQLLATFFLIFPAIVFLTLLFVRSGSIRSRPRGTYAPTAVPPPLPASSDGSSPAIAERQTWSPPAGSSAIPSDRPPRSRRIHSPPQKLRILANFIGWSLHFVTFIIAILVALDLPGFIAAGLLEPRMAEQLNRDFGARWPHNAHLCGYVLVYLGAFLATAFLMLARRSQGAAHMLRPILAAICFVGGLYLLDAALPSSWVAAGSTPARIDHADSIARYFDAANAKAGIVSLFLALAGLALLIWPGPQPRWTQATALEEGVS